MTAPSLTVSTVSALELSGDVLVIGVTSTDAGPELASPGAGFDAVQNALKGIGVTGAKDEVTRIPALVGAAASIALVGLGSGPVTANGLRYAAGSAARQLTGIESLIVALPTSNDDEVLAVLEGAAIGAYAYTQYRSSSLEKTKTPATAITITAKDEVSDAIVARAATVADAMHSVRDLVNAPPGDLYPSSFADAVVASAKDSSVTVTVLAEEELAEGGFGGLLGVGMGSARGPRLVKLEYSPDGAAKHLALVGKGITFDTGGLSLKPAGSMVGMKYDMTGAATVMAVMVAAAKLELPVRITGWLCLAENMPSGTATRPNDVLTIRGGTTVEVLNTDAEGRLVLADGLVAASEEHPDAIIDVATLTGAAIVALGARYTAAMGDEALVGRVTDVATRVGEPVWPMPLPEELRAAINSDVADLANARIGNTAGGMLLAGVFLKEFVGTTADDDKKLIPWAHLDIAGPSNNTGGGYGFTGKGPTGVSVRTLLAVAEEFGRA